MPAVRIGDLNFIYEDFGLGLFQEIHVAATLDFLDGQNLIDAIRQAEASDVGLSYPSIADAFGKVRLSPRASIGITVQLLDNWKIYTLKDSGTFSLGEANIVKPDGSSPFVPNSAVTYIQNLSVASTVVTGGGGGAGAGAADIWAYPNRSLTDKAGFSLSPVAIAAIWAYTARTMTSFGNLIADFWSYTTRSLSGDQATQLQEVHQIHGLDSTSPLTVTDTTRTAGAIHQAIAETTGATTVTRQ